MITPLRLFVLLADIVLSFWWIIVPPLLFVTFFKFWMLYIRFKFWANMDWVLLEVIPSREVQQSPKAVESIFAGLWPFYGTVATKVDKYIKGATQEYFTLEIVGIDGDIHFYIRCLRSRRNHVEAQFYAQFPDAEIKEVEDYTRNVPDIVKSPDWDMWGTKLKLTNPEDAYPIRTYADFIDVAPLSTSATFIDPLAILIETLSKLKTGEQVWIQIYCRPTDDSWKERGQKILQKIMGTAPPPKKGAVRSLFDDFLTGTGFAGAGAGGSEEPAVPRAFLLSEEDRSAMKAIDRKISKKGFEAKIQWIYLGRKDVFSKSNIGAIMGIFNQLNNLSLNGLKPDLKMMTRAAYLFVEQRLNFKKRVLFEATKARKFFEPGYVLNTEELATLFHFPASYITTPKTPRIESKKSGPPPFLPVG